MNLKRLMGSIAIAGVIGASSLGVGAGVASAEAQPAGWHGYYDHGRGYGHGYYRGGWPVDRWWHPWGGPWHW